MGMGAGMSLPPSPKRALNFEVSGFKLLKLISSMGSAVSCLFSNSGRGLLDSCSSSPSYPGLTLFSKIGFASMGELEFSPYE